MELQLQSNAGAIEIGNMQANTSIERDFILCLQAAVGADYRVSYVSSIHAGSTHDSTAFQSTALHEILGKSVRDGGLPNWATVAADDAYGNKGRILSPYRSLVDIFARLIRLLFVILSKFCGTSLWYKC
jgi:hypothetical protein